MKNAMQLDVIQSRTARVAVSASASRGRGNAGVVPAARAFLCNLNLSRFGKAGPGFFKELDLATSDLVKALPKDARRWGIARKLLNIFLRDSLYTTYLCSEFSLDRAEELYEVPLDSLTAKALKASRGGSGLPGWPGVRNVTPELSAVYQDAALAEAQRLNVARVHLDALWWSQSRD